MNTKLSSSQLKSISRGQLLGKYGAAISINLMVGAILLAASALCSAFSDQSSAAGLVISYLITLILDILSGVFQVGLTRFYLNLVCGQPYRSSDAFYGFYSHADRAIAVRFLILLMELVCMAPFLFCAFLYLQTEDAFVFLLASLMLVVGVGLIIRIALLYSQVYYIMLDFPGYGIRQIMAASRNIMKGHKGRLFYLCVSLLPYYLLSFLSCGIALLWVVPFRRTIFTNFYLDLMHKEYTV